VDEIENGLKLIVFGAGATSCVLNVMRLLAN